MLKREQEERKSRRASLDEGAAEPTRDIKNETNSNDRQALVYLKELILF